ncbi:DUF389 domain-containing protein [Erythrobacter sp. SD-21]|uniref:DUF389 domain-containing protein n=1 Tax=Erythrobacter sp. SD-21 TaxID=161528 RepID=UPI000153F7C9|nr:DUF389 domain-containing protein [Erythrobacter sp. SD-21]EDL48063.1 hypothetical protein ED21_29491 [Erythrobacter sp. SD-21]
MRQLALTVSSDEAAATVAAAQTHGLTLFAQFEAREQEEVRRVLILEAPNGRIEDFLAEVEDNQDLRALFAPQGIISLRPPTSEPESQMLDIQPRSPLEVFLGALQSIGSWPGFLAYAVVGGVIVWIGLFTESVFLLVAAMLIAPFAGPAMTLAIATARGDANLLGRSLLRYVAALAASITTAFLLSMAFNQQIATELMIETSMRSTVSLLLPLAAGVAGALNLVQSERSSLVSGAATGMLVAAALAPPAGLVGMGLAIGQMDIVVSSLWALGIQIVGINLAGCAVFRIYGMRTKGARYPRGKGWISIASVASSMVALAVLLVLQFSNVPQFQQSSISQRVSALVVNELDRSPEIRLVTVNSHFTRSREQGDNPVWVSVQVQASLDKQEVSAVADRIEKRVESEFPVTALVDLTAKD